MENKIILNDWILINDKWHRIVIELYNEYKKLYLDGKLFSTTYKNGVKYHGIELNAKQVKELYDSETK